MAGKSNVRGVWAATVATLVAPMESERASGKITTLIEALYPPLPDAAFTMESARYIASNGYQVDAVTSGPLKRVPTFGELEAALNRWWGNKKEMQQVRADIQADPAAQQRLDELRRNPHVPRIRGPERDLTPGTAEIEHVESVVKAFERERSWNREGGRPAASKTPPKPLTHSDARLIMEYEKLSERTDEFGELARMRLEMLLARTDR